MILHAVEGTLFTDTELTRLLPPAFDQTDQRTTPMLLVCANFQQMQNATVQIRTSDFVQNSTKAVERSWASA